MSLLKVLSDIYLEIFHFQHDWINRSFYDVIHPEDINKMKDQLATEVSNETRILDLKSMYF